MSHTLRLFSHFTSSSPFRVRLVLAYKGIPYELVPVDTAKGEQHEPEMVAKNPMRQVPVLELCQPGLSSVLVTQSLAICELLEELHPLRPVLPADPLLRAAVRSVCNTIACGVQPFQNLATLKYLKRLVGTAGSAEPQVQLAEWVQNYVGGGMAALETQVSKTAGAYCVGDSFSLADAFLLPQMFASARLLAPYGYDEAAYPTLHRIATNLKAMPELRPAFPEAQPGYQVPVSK